MFDWLADVLLNAGAIVASRFVSKDETNFFAVFQMMIATLVLGAIVSVMVYWQSPVEYRESRWRPRK
jgi:hypothetical protein